ncbi:S-adenosyl methyltransferase [Pseudonocardia hierapolitana]|uniref:S-adenosyl methyltransferase n=1 Tax=Pseudonocardia hierapolitana TaxID=1128676 RepID=A0A561T2M7_9PSEU|nr:SAM-dependent methyltransferase [Pseudonocardia hierapolitana]TWF81368.1 S-adenosyl methyltransferase [Pseudonocardia hierapolitana]
MSGTPFEPSGFDPDDPPVPPSRRIDPSKPNLARVYDSFLAGKDNYSADRAVVREIHSVTPELARVVQEERAWLGRVTRFLVKSARIEQILHVGSGMPTIENTHEAAQRFNADTRVIYVADDPVVLAHGRAILEENDLTHLVEAGFAHPDDVLGHDTVKKYLEPDEPVALIHSRTMHHVAGRQHPHEIVQRYLERLPSGSYLVLSHFCDPQDDGPGTQLARLVEGVFTRSGLDPVTFRPRAEIEKFFDGLQLVEPGVTRLRDWWPDGPLLAPSSKEDDMMLGGVARKP